MEITKLSGKKLMGKTFPLLWNTSIRQRTMGAQCGSCMDHLEDGEGYLCVVHDIWFCGYCSCTEDGCGEIISAQEYDRRQQQSRRRERRRARRRRWRARLAAEARARHKARVEERYLALMRRSPIDEPNLDFMTAVF